jgi:hypothetical protein
LSYEVSIERGKIREFARAAKSTQAAYDRSAAVIPPTFLTTARSFWAPPADDDILDELGFDLARVLHGEEEFEFFGPLPTAGQVLHAQTRLGERWEKEGKRGGTMKFARLVTEFRDGEGALVAEERTTVVETARPPKDS